MNEFARERLRRGIWSAVAGAMIAVTISVLIFLIYAWFFGPKEADLNEQIRQASHRTL